MVDRLVALQTDEGEVVTRMAIYPVLRRAPFKDWAVLKCFRLNELELRELPKGVEAEIAWVLLLRAHEVTRTTQLARLLGRDVATICRALKRLHHKGLVRHLDRGEWAITNDLVHYGRWRRVNEHGK